MVIQGPLLKYGTSASSPQVEETQTVSPCKDSRILNNERMALDINRLLECGLFLIHTQRETRDGNTNSIYINKDNKQGRGVKRYARKVNEM